MAVGVGSVGVGSVDVGLAVGVTSANAVIVAVLGVSVVGSTGSVHPDITSNATIQKVVVFICTPHCEDARRRPSHNV